MIDDPALARMNSIAAQTFAALSGFTFTAKVSVDDVRDLLTERTQLLADNALLRLEIAEERKARALAEESVIDQAHAETYWYRRALEGEEILKDAAVDKVSLPTRFRKEDNAYKVAVEYARLNRTPAK